MSLIVLVGFLHIIFDQQDPFYTFSFSVRLSAQGVFLNLDSISLNLVEKEVLDTEQDKELGSEEDPLEPSEETNSSSED